MILVNLELLVEWNWASSLAAVLQLVAPLLEPLDALLDELSLAVMGPQMDEEPIVSPLPLLQAEVPGSHYFGDESAHSDTRGGRSEQLQFAERDRQWKLFAVQDLVQAG